MKEKLEADNCSFSNIAGMVCYFFSLKGDVTNKTRMVLDFRRGSSEGREAHRIWGVWDCKHTTE